jgi:pimeloyl-ACP methyl ester carboxylesterase
MSTTTYHSLEVGGLKVFYREAGRKGAPALLLLHGFPTAGHVFRDSSRCWPIAFTSSRPISPASGSPICPPTAHSNIRSATWRG